MAPPPMREEQITPLGETASAAEAGTRSAMRPPPPPRPSARLRAEDAERQMLLHPPLVRPPLMPTGMHEVPRTLAPQVADVPLHTAPPPASPQRRTALWVGLAATGGLLVGLLARTPSHREVTFAPAAPGSDLQADAQANLPDDRGEAGIEAEEMDEPADDEVLDQPLDDRAPPAFQDVWTPPATPEGEWGPAAGEPSAAAPVAPASPAVAPAADGSPATPAPTVASTGAPSGRTGDPTAAPPQAAAAPASAAFDRGAASSALEAAMITASACRASLDPSGTARVAVTFAPSGRATQAVVTSSPFAGTTTGGCIARAFRALSVAPFTGDPVTVTKTVAIR